MDILQIVGIAGAIFLAALVQSGVGFGYALLATPLLIWLGLSLPDAVVIVAVCSFVQSAAGTVRLRAVVPWRISLTATAVRIVCVSVGLFVLKRLALLDPGHVRMVVGFVTCVLVAVQYFNRARPSAGLHAAWGAVAFSVSGLLAGICGMGGPPLVLWALAHDWSADKTRGFLFSTFAVSIPVQILLMRVVIGPTVLQRALVGLALIPVVFLGSAIGLPLGDRMPKPVLCKVVYFILLAIGISSMVRL